MPSTTTVDNSENGLELVAAGPSMNFTLKQSGLSFDFPLPPMPISPTPSLSHSFSTQNSNTVPLPLTPPCSDDDDPLSLSPPTLPPPRVSIKPLHIVKRSQDVPLNLLPTEHETSWLDDDDNINDNEDEEDEEDHVSDTEEATAWYTHEFSQIVTTSSRLPPQLTSTHPQARRESTTIPAFSKRRRSSARKSPIHPLPPVPPIPSISASSSGPPANIIISPEPDEDKSGTTTAGTVDPQDEVNALTSEDANHSEEQQQLPNPISSSPVDLETDEILEIEKRDMNTNRVEGFAQDPPPTSSSSMANDEKIVVIDRHGKQNQTQPRPKWPSPFLATPPRSSSLSRDAFSSKMRFLHLGGGKWKKGNNSGGGGNHEMPSYPPEPPMSYWDTSSHSRSHSLPSSPFSAVFTIPPIPRSLKNTATSTRQRQQQQQREQLSDEVVSGWSSD